MSKTKEAGKEYSPVLTCGASAMFLNHKEGEFTIFDRIAAAVKHSSTAKSSRREQTIARNAAAHTA